MDFTLISSDKNSRARAGVIKTDHGVIETPIFMPVGTVGSVKGVHFEELRHEIEAQIILGNTYHLFLRPGLDVIKKAGGLHKFNGWDRPILTDSGGYQVFSLAANRKLNEEGAVFRSHIDGTKYVFTPENVVETQRIIGADIIMAFDECTPGTADFKYAKSSMELTHRWLDRGLTHFDKTEPIYGHSQTFFPIVQGGVFPELRKISAEYIANTAREGYAIGGLSVGEPTEKMYEMTDIVTQILPKEQPRYLMGVGTPANILESIGMGVDMFDCVMPTRNGRNGMLFTSEGIMNMKNERWKEDFSPLDPNGSTFVDSHYTKAYVRHLFVAKEMLAAQIGSIHNLGFYLWLVKEARKHIIAGDFQQWKEIMVKKVTTRL